MFFKIISPIIGYTIFFKFAEQFIFEKSFYSSVFAAALTIALSKILDMFSLKIFVKGEGLIKNIKKFKQLKYYSIRKLISDTISYQNDDREMKDFSSGYNEIIEQIYAVFFVYLSVSSLFI